MAGIASIGGVISGLDTNNIIDQLIALERAPITRLQTKKSTLNAKLSAWQDANTRILALKAKAEQLANNTTFDTKLMTSSDESIIDGSVSYTAQTGTYYLKVNQLARAHQMKTEGYADPSAEIGTGSITITIGSGAPKVITIDETNNTLTGLKDAINQAGVGIKASIVNDGSGDTPYRLVITSETSGTQGQITIDCALSGDTPLSFTTMQAAQDACITLGEGEGAITVYKSKNEITDLIPGVTLKLKAVDVDKTVTITVNNDTSEVKKYIQEFVEQYNNLLDFINQQFKYDTTTNKGGVLFADSSLAAIQADLNDKIFSPVSGLNQTIKVLSQIGITNSRTDGKLVIEETALADALDANIDEIKNLFSTIGTTTNSRVTFIAAGANTKTPGPEGYTVEITAVATRARVTAGISQTEALAQDEEIVINGQTITLNVGMTPEQVVSRINEFSAKTGVVASRTDINGEGSGNYLTLTRSGYGSAGTISVKSNVSNLSGAGTTGIGTALVTHTDFAGEAGTGTGAAGTDVEGTINGEPAIGKGQILTGKEGNATTDGLTLRITAQATGNYGTVSFSKGIASVLNDYLDFITRPTTGAVKSAQDDITSSMKAIDDDIAMWEERIEIKRERLIIKFAMMESALSKLKGQGNYLASTLGQFSSE